MSVSGRLFKSLRFLLPVSAAVVWLPAAHAALIGTYVDAAQAPGGNTTPASAFTPSGPSIATDNLWTLRSDSVTAGAQGGNVLESNGDGGENSPLITTTLTALSTGTAYTIRLVYWAIPGNVQWGLQSALSGSSLTIFDASNGVATGATTNGNSIYEYQAILGTVSNVSSVAVNVDDISGTFGRRAWFDGLTYTAVPEPAALPVLILGGMCVLARRRCSKTRSLSH